MKIVLISLDDTPSVPELVTDKLPLYIGSNQSADLCLDEPWVSDFHCIVEQADNRLTIRDLGSRYGTRVNGSRIAEYELFPGDQLQIGKSTYQISFRRPFPLPRQAENFSGWYGVEHTGARRGENFSAWLQR